MKKYLPIIITAVVVGGLAFWGGWAFGTNQAAASRTAAFAGAGAAGRRFGGGAGAAGAAGFGGAGGSATIGQIVAVDGNSITVQSAASSTSASSGSKIIFFSTTTPIMEMVSGSPSDLSVGREVVITGTANSDGSITATSIQLRPQARGAGAEGQAPAAQ